MQSAEITDAAAGETLNRFNVSPAAASVISALCISVFEAFFHRYLQQYVLPEDYQDTTETDSTLWSYQTEASEELVPEKDPQEKT